MIYEPSSRRCCIISQSQHLILRPSVSNYQTCSWYDEEWLCIASFQVKNSEQSSIKHWNSFCFVSVYNLFYSTPNFVFFASEFTFLPINSARLSGARTRNSAVLFYLKVLFTLHRIWLSGFLETRSNDRIIIMIVMTKMLSISSWDLHFNHLGDSMTFSITIEPESECWISGLKKTWS